MIQLVDSASHPLHLQRDQWGWTTHRDGRAEFGEAPDVAARDPRVRDVAHDGHTLALERAHPLTHGHHVQEALGRVLVHPVPRVDHSGGDPLGEVSRRAALAMTHHDHVDLHGQDVLCGVPQGLTLLQRAAGGSEVDDVGATLLSSDIAKKIQGEMEYPGQIKVTVIRETRAIDYAK